MAGTKTLLLDDLQHLIPTEEPCGCGEDHGHAHHHEKASTHVSGSSTIKRTYVLENLGCANCAAKMERKIQQLPGITDASVVFSTKQLRVEGNGNDMDALFPEFQRICAEIESQVIVVPKDGNKQSAVMKRTYLLENLGCANCAAKMENKIQQLSGVTDASVVFSTKQLRVEGKNIDALFSEFQRICAEIESQVIVVPKDGKKSVIQANNAESGEEISVQVMRGERANVAQKESKISKKLTWMIVGSAIFLLTALGQHIFNWELPQMIWIGLYGISYLILAIDIIKATGRNLRAGEIFDENFLMLIASLGAFIIGDQPEAVAVILFYRIGEAFEQRAVEKSRAAIMDTVDMRPESVTIVDDLGKETIIDANEAKIGDIVILAAGSRIPLDSVVVQGESSIDTSPVTGESMPVSVRPGSKLISGGINLNGQLKIRIEKPLSESMVTRILEAVENAAAGKPKMERFITRFARVYTPIVCLLAIVFAILPPLVGWTGWSDSVYRALTFLVVSCPCALVLSVPLAFFAGIGNGSRKGILVKSGASLEALNEIKTVVFDKTGTLTRGVFAVSNIETNGDTTEDQLIALAANAESHSTHPIAESLRRELTARRLSEENAIEVEEIAGFGLRAKMSAGMVLCGNRALMERNSISVTETDQVSHTQVYVALNGQYLGRIIVEDMLKADAAEAVSLLKKKGIKTVMLTGDDVAVAERIAKIAGIDEVYAKLLPDQKLEKLQMIRQRDGEVMFIGDGINDAPVLAGADVGAAMGTGADAAVEAADVVFMNTQVGSVNEALHTAQRTRSIATQNVIFALTIKLLVMVLSVFGYANMWLAVFADVGVALLCVANSLRLIAGSGKPKRQNDTNQVSTSIS